MYYYLFILHLSSLELGRLPRVKTCANLMRKICYNNKDRMMAGMICGGWDPYNGGQVFEIPLGGTIMPQRFAIGILLAAVLCFDLPMVGIVQVAVVQHISTVW